MFEDLDKFIAEIQRKFLLLLGEQMIKYLNWKHSWTLHLEKKLRYLYGNMEF